MELTHSFTVPVSLEQAGAVLRDVLGDLEQVARCVPGATLEHSNGGAVAGRLKVRVGPMDVTYAGEARVDHRDSRAHIAVIDATGTDTRGFGTARAVSRCSVLDEGTEATKVTVTTDLRIAGRPAQFGSEALADVGNKVIGAFMACLAEQIRTAVGARMAAAAVPPRGERLLRAGGAGRPPEDRAGDLAVPLGTDGPAGVADQDAVVPAGTAAAAGAAEPVGAPAPAATDKAFLKRWGPAVGSLAAVVVIWRVLGGNR